MLNTSWVISEMIFAANLLTGLKHPSAFSTNHFANSDKTTTENNQTRAAFFKSFRKGFVICRGLDVNLSGKVAKKTTLTRKSGHHAHVFLPQLSLRTKFVTVSPSTDNAAATAYIHIKVAIVTHSHFGNAKPKFHMNCALVIY